MAGENFVPSLALLRSLSQIMRSSETISVTRAVANTSSTSRCLRRPMSSSARREASTQQSIPPAPEPKTPEFNHQRYRDGELIPKPLSRPLGLPHPPQPGQNTGVDTRSWNEKRDEFARYDKHLERRRGLLTQLFERNYYRDIGNLGKVHKGKSMLAPSTPFRASLAMYFPNLTGFTLAGGAGLFRGKDHDTTPVLRDRISIVSVINTEWANTQAASFISQKDNDALHALICDYAPAQGLVQFATINAEENPLKAWIVRVFWGRLRRMIPKEQWTTYFLNRRGLTDDIRDALGMWNSKVGYVYLLDGSCRVRWAGNGFARDEEKQSLVMCVRRLVDEAHGVQKMKVKREDAKPTTELRRKQQHAASQDQVVAA